MNSNEYIVCPYCREDDANPWARERGYVCVKCNACGFLYVNPRPVAAQISEGVETGVHSSLGGHNVVGRYSSAKVKQYRTTWRGFMPDVWQRNSPIAWLDVGAGHGEIVEAVASLAPAGSRIMGIEPMRPKSESAQSRGVNVVRGYLCDVSLQFDFISLIHVFSHIPDFRVFLSGIRDKLNGSGELIIETGNMGDLDRPTQNSTDLDLPDHLAFAGKQHVIGFLEEGGFEVVAIREVVRDAFFSLAKAIVKKLIGRPAHLIIPYTSPYRNLTVRARLK